jgi:tetratricopeptide (TPR) repeat protein
MATVSSMAQFKTAKIDSLIQAREVASNDSAYFHITASLAFEWLNVNPLLAQSIIEEGIEKAEIMGYIEGMARMYKEAGNFYWTLSAYDAALENYYKAKDLFEKTNDHTALAILMNNIGEVFKKQGRYEDAQTYLFKAQVINLEHEDPRVTLLILTNLGELSLLKGDLEEGKRLLFQALPLADQSSNMRIKAYAYQYLAKLYALEEKKDLATEYVDKSLSLRAEIGDFRGTILSQILKAEIATLQNRNFFAEAILNKALEKSRSLGIKDLEMHCHEALYRLYYENEEFKTAIENLNRYNFMKDSIFTQVKALQIARLQSVNMLQIREKENEELLEEQKKTKDQIYYQNLLLLSGSVAILIMTFLISLLFIQRKKIERNHQKLSFQKKELEENRDEIKEQAEELITLNQQLSDLNRTLEDKILERTKLLEVQNEKLAHYAFINAHKLRAPVASILGLINVKELSRNGELDLIILENLKLSAEKLDMEIKNIRATLEEEGHIVHEETTIEELD